MVVALSSVVFMPKSLWHKSLWHKGSLIRVTFLGLSIVVWRFSLGMYTQSPDLNSHNHFYRLHLRSSRLCHDGYVGCRGVIRLAGQEYSI